ncbi:ABC transporter ATP-binding protein [Brucella gallinifaecis]|uniref:ABC transporter ATP-binding protein n=1 Tax=Brucella gallinifaecis TaxID=215590 RepID=UPI0023624967|nr:ABC transporter ATP-binding protein [Brucella gallinifaecis]
MRAIIGHHTVKLVASAILAIAGTACGFVPFLCVYWIAQSAGGGRLDQDTLLINAGIAFAAIVGKVGLNIISSALSHRAAYHILYDTRRALIRKIDTVPLGFFSSNSVAGLKKTINEDVEQIEEALAHAIPDVASAIAVPLAVGALLAFIDWRLALAALAMYPLLILIYPLSLKMAKAEMAGYFGALVALRASALEFLQGMKVIRTFVAVDTAFSKLDSAITGMAEATWKMSTAAAVPSAFMMVGLRANILILLPVGGLLVTTGQITGNQFVLFLLLGMGVNASVFKLLYTAGSFSMRMRYAGKNIRDILSTESLKQPAEPKYPQQHDIVFDNVTFAYEGGRGINNVSFTAPAGSYTAIVGPSGGGKTTIARLIGRLWDINDGAVRIGGIDVRDIPTDVLISQISYIMQDAWLLNASIRENIHSARPDASNAEIEEAARKARVLDFSDALSGGLDTQVGEGGKLLSGGQRQRVAIARAILRASPIVIMDEGTSALDPDNEMQILEALEELSKGRTVISIAHRLNTIRGADNILYVEDGGISGQGPHEALIKSSPAYAGLCAKYAAIGGWKLQNSTDFALLPTPAAPPSDGSVTDEAIVEEKLDAGRNAIAMALDLAGPMRSTLLGRALPLLFLESMMMGAPVIATLLVLLDINANTLTVDKVWAYVWIVALFFCAQILCHIIASRVLWRVQTGAVAALQRRLAKHLRRVPLGVLQERDTGVLETLLTQHTTELNYVTPSLQLIRAVVSPLLSIAFMFYFDWRLALCVVATVPVFLLVILACDRISHQVWLDMFASRESLNSRIIDYLQGIPTLRSLGIAGSESRELMRALANHRDISLATVTRVSPAVALGLSVLDAGFCTILVGGGLLVISGSLAFPVYLVFLIAGLVFYGPIGDAFELVFYRRQQERSMIRIADILNLPVLAEKQAPRQLQNYDIRFENVSFAYGKRQALTNVNLEIRAGEFAAFAGPSGSGKTTALNLLARFWDVDQGRILVGGVDLRDLPDTQRSALFTIVFQDTFLLNDTVAANLRLACPSASMEEIVAAAKAAHCHEFVSELENGYDTVVGEGGSNLSGGQRQRIAIARAILKDAPIVLLDEATAAIDPDNEYDIRMALSALCAGRTVILVAHRLSSIVDIDRIIVFDEGVIAGSGTSCELRANCATFRRLWDAQTGCDIGKDMSAASTA